MFGDLARRSCQGFILPSLLQVKIDLPDIPVFVSTDLSPQKITTQQKEGLETGREFRYLFPQKIFRMQCLGPVRKEPEPEVSYYETWQE
jgi:hypothetical protein